MKYSHHLQKFLSVRSCLGAVLVASLLSACGGAENATNLGYRSAKLDRGDIRVVISATGNLHAVSTVDVGAQVSGQVVKVHVDYNSAVKAGDVIAEIDPANFAARLEQSNADLVSAQASLSAARANSEEARVVERNAQVSAERARTVREKGLISAADLDSATLALDQSKARVKSTQASVAVAQAAVSQRTAAINSAKLDLEHTRIRAPVDGVVLLRSVQPGQTVAASFQTPLLFQIAENLSEMELDLAIDEADIGQVRDGQPVSFNVDAYPNRRFTGVVKQVRLAATNVSNVISYPVIVSVANGDLRLFPGMTANAEIEVGARTDVLRVANAALRFTPPGQSAAATGPGGGPQGGRRPGGGMGDDLAEKLNLTPEQRSVYDSAMTEYRQQMQAQFAALRASGAAPDENLRAQMQQRMTKVINQLKPMLSAEQQALLETEIAARRDRRRATVWVQRGKDVQSIPVTVGLSDGDYTEVIDGPELKVGSEVLTGVNKATP
jgi:HlyD family secretion protein